MKVRVALGLLVAVSPSPLAAQQRGTATTQPFTAIGEKLLEGIVERSPAGRYQNRDYLPGVRSLRVAKRCSCEDVVTLFKLADKPQVIRIPDETEVFRDRTPNERTASLTITVADFEALLVTEVMRMLQLFSDDPAVNRRELYVVSAVFPAPNAVSVGLGFLVFDPHLFFQIARHESTNGWSMRAAIAHELAHQLQFWHDEPLTKKTKNGELYARDKELQADGIAAALLTRLRDEGLTSDRKADDEYATFSDALGRAFISLGDFELASQDHHGTAWERALMVVYGHEIADLLKTQKNRRANGLLAASRAKIEAMNQRFGEVWPSGKRL